MYNRCAYSVVAVLLLTSAGFAAIGQTPGHTLVAPSHTATVGHPQMAYSYYLCSAVGLQQHTAIIGCQYQVIRCFYWGPCGQPCKPPHFIEGGDATATVTAVSYDGNADATAQAVGGDAILVITCKPPSDPPCLVKGGDASASASAVSYGGNARATAHAVGGDAIVVIK